MIAKSRLFIMVMLVSIVTIFGGACTQRPTPTPTPPVIYSIPELKYLLISNFDNVFWCDPDLYPIERPGQEETNALEQFLVIREDEAEFTAILEYLSLSIKDSYTNEEKLLVYRQHKKLTRAVEITASGDAYKFVLRVGEGQGERIEGSITTSGKIEITKREPSINSCPICLATGTLIDTPTGRIPVEQLRKGMTVWTVDNAGKLIAGQVVETIATPVTSSFEVLRLRLNDGRTVIASAGHPTSEGKPLGDYQTGDNLDGSLVAAAEHLVYDGGATYDLLPSGGSGLYWANGILLKSTLATD
jgi:hypothetical protein